MTRHAAPPETVPWMEVLEPRLLLSASVYASPVQALSSDNPSSAALVQDGSAGGDASGAAQGAAAGDHGQIVAAKKPGPQPPAPQPPSLTPPGYLPSDAAYTTAAQVITGSAVPTTSGQYLLVLGTAAADTITVSQSGSGLTLTTVAGSQLFSGSFVGVAVYGFVGTDTVRLTSTVTVTSVIYGGADNDKLFAAGPGVDYEYGQDGDDLLVTVGGKADVVRGGAGLDSFWIDSTDLAPDVESAEPAGTSVHTITSFLQPTNKANVSLEIAGQNLADPTTSYKYYDFSSVPLWVDGPDYNDVAQGNLGDCYYLAALGSLSRTRPALMSQMIAPMGDGSYAVRFYQSGQPVYVRVDAQLPGTAPGKLGYAQFTPDGELWVALTEKAYAQFRYGRNSYQSISGGWVNVTYTELTGLASASWSTTSWATGDALGQFITAEIGKGYTLAGGTITSAKTPIIGNHAYEVLGASQAGDGSWSVTVYNPWGIDGVTWDAYPNDGVLVIPMNIFMLNFSAVYESYA